MYQEPTGGRPANRPPNRAAGGWRAWQAPVWRPVSSNALLGSALPRYRTATARAGGTLGRQDRATNGTDVLNGDELQATVGTG